MDKNYNLLNGGSLAFIGDGIYEIKIRKYCLDKGYTNLRVLHNECVKYVSRTSQTKIITCLINQNELKEDELEIFHRGRNFDYKTKTMEYVNASGFEAVIGYLYLTEQVERLEEIINRSIEIINEN